MIGDLIGSLSKVCFFVIVSNDFQKTALFLQINSPVILPSVTYTTLTI